MKTLSALVFLGLFSYVAVAQQMPPGHPPMDAKSGAKGAPSQMPAGHPPAGATQGKASSELTHKGKVLSTIDIPNYTYLEVSENNKTIWLAAPTVAVKKGDTVRFEDGMPMTNFHSKSLNRTFPSISFISNVVVSK